LRFFHFHYHQQNRPCSFYNSSYGAGQIYTSQGTSGTQLCYSSITAGYTELNCAVDRGGYWALGVMLACFLRICILRRRLPLRLLVFAAVVVNLVAGIW